MSLEPVVASNNLPYNFTGCVANDISSSSLKIQGHNNTRLVARSFLSYILWLENYHMMGLDMNKKHCKITFHVSWCILKFKILLIFVVLNMTRCFSDLAVMDKAIWEEMELFGFPTFPCLLTHKEWINKFVITCLQNHESNQPVMVIDPIPIYVLPKITL